MCTLAVAWRRYRGLPLVVAANRDERLDRPAVGPFAWAGERFVAPRDEVAGGTWLGVTSTGLFVGVTNRFGVPRDDARLSRGQLVVEALRQPDAKTLHRFMAGVSPLAYNAFHLLYADAEAAFVTYSDGERLHQRALEHGVHVVTERSLGGDDRERTERVQLAWASFGDEPPPPESLMTLLRQHGEGEPLGGVCVHVPAFGYGTRSSAVIALPDRSSDARFFWAEGPPCRAPYEDRSGLLRALLR